MDKPIVIGACVYLIYCKAMDLYKIGYTTQMPEKRKAQIESPNGNPWNCQLELEVRALILCETEEIARHMESRLHSDGYCKNAQADLGREWFTDLTYCHHAAFSDDTGKVWGWREVAMYMDYEVNDAIEGENIVKFMAASDIKELRKHLLEVAKISDSMIASVNNEDLEAFQKLAEKQAEWKQVIITK